MMSMHVIELPCTSWTDSRISASVCLISFWQLYTFLLLKKFGHSFLLQILHVQVTATWWACMLWTFIAFCAYASCQISYFIYFHDWLCWSYAFYELQRKKSIRRKQGWSLPMLDRSSCCQQYRPSTLNETLKSVSRCAFT